MGFRGYEVGLQGGGLKKYTFWGVIDNFAPS